MTTILDLFGTTDEITGYTVNGNLVSIDLDDTSFSTLQSRGWMNFRQQNMLLLKLNDTHLELLQTVAHMLDQETLGLTMTLKKGLFALVTTTPTLLIVLLQVQPTTFWNATIQV